MKIEENMTQEMESFADEVLADFADEIAMGDALLKEIVERDGRATFAELGYFAKHLNWSESRTKEELRRMHSVLRFRSIAGASGDREAAKIEAETAAKVLVQEGPKLEAKISELQSKLRSLETDARLSEKRVEEQSEAVQQLRRLTPQHVRDAVLSAVGILDNTLKRAILDGETRINELECNLSPSKYATEESYLESLRRSCRAAVDERVSGSMIRYGLSSSWPSIKSAMEAELIELRKEIEIKQAEYDAKLAVIVAPLDFYAS